MRIQRKSIGLTARKVETLKKAGLFADGNGLYLQVTATGAKTWIFRFQIAGRRRDMGLGSLTVISLAEARQRASEARKLVESGVDPLDAKKAEKASQALDAARATTFKDCAVSARSSEVLEAVWPELVLEAALWTIPAERMKAGVGHRVPLTLLVGLGLGRREHCRCCKHREYQLSHGVPH